LSEIPNLFSNTPLILAVLILGDVTMPSSRINAQIATPSNFIMWFIFILKRKKQLHVEVAVEIYTNIQTIDKYTYNAMFALFIQALA
jgi:hypothetical protein